MKHEKFEKCRWCGVITTCTTECTRCLTLRHMIESNFDVASKLLSFTKGRREAAKETKRESAIQALVDVFKKMKISIETSDYEPYFHDDDYTFTCNFEEVERRLHK